MKEKKREKERNFMARNTVTPWDNSPPTSDDSKLHLWCVSLPAPSLPADGSLSLISSPVSPPPLFFSLF